MRLKHLRRFLNVSNAFETFANVFKIFKTRFKYYKRVFDISSAFETFERRFKY